ncbi:ABC-type transport auxiliary lipoprotein family protein [Rhizobium sp. VS19-DR104.2]|uniref:ABC-type transport auxiliary lipoprotein family protein n=1 Tax=unclassified Rhizobium TaxID=2613769 RepID=UPI001C5B0BA0|nr:MULTISPECIES: ABC-type transport auxiliary lipoprotein family protein [unclassified Rhizobium]MBZ5758233.1 ABC-type transport auxiliary lipoprotein family protein [Rhizobium sp. VS19-DR96]MBZ5764937.1 ABC-type transport auxiliary lipoprotein family protein [Rhizobium sp. VS19-DR129.2]MBZ5772480.1 ABC-type transport auxiliary lipoprotein family protein [Rhizobium sp. VS19-DRK62.2]MBZ5782833.1 ABC-type transport auxiliary lipoprotein family protein [Rhizobium sp. VS19-DR121]MBZ5800281.1 ABC-t
MLEFGSVQGWLTARRSVVALPVLAALLTACGSGAKNDTFDLAANVSGKGPAAHGKQILVPAPTALSAIDSNQIVVRVSGSELQYLAKAQWSDKLSRMVQSKLVEAFENSGKVGGVGVPGQGLAIDYQVVTDIRAFEIDTTKQAAVVEISAKILNDKTGTVRKQDVFRVAVPTTGTTNDAYVKSLDRAFASVSAQIVDWTLKSI